MSDNAQLIKKLLGEKMIAYSPVLARCVGGAKAAIILQQFMYWTPRTSDPNGWFYKTVDELEQETGLSKEEQLTAIKALTANGCIEVKLKGVPAKRHFKVDYDIVIICLESSPQPVVAKADNLMEEKPTTIYTENTTEKEKQPSVVKRKNVEKEYFPQLTKQKGWEIAMQYKVSMEDVKRVYDRVMDMVKTGEMKERYPKYHDTNRVVRNWLSLQIDKGQIEQLDELGMMWLERLEPDRLYNQGKYAKT